jgi:uncharacterized protein Yka (UPF0111/DUF47 family)
VKPWRGHNGRWRLPGWIERLSLSSGPDVMALLVAQGEVSVKAMEAFELWSKGEDVAAAAQQVQDLEHAADDARHSLVAALKRSLATPIGQEDLFVLSERCDRVVNRVKNIVVEAESLSWSPDPHAAEMARQLHSGMTFVLTGFKTLTTHGDEAADAAGEITHFVRGMEREYRNATAELSTTPDLRQAFTRHEIYRRYLRAAEALESLADRLWYAVLAEP